MPIKSLFFGPDRTALLRCCKRVIFYLKQITVTQIFSLQNHIIQKTKRDNLKLFSIFNKKKLLCYLLLSGAVVKGFTQNSETALLTQQFDNYRKNSLPEKIFVHTDKDFYVAGEILWFKLYNVDAVSLKPLDLSKVAYVEIVNANQKPVFWP